MQSTTRSALILLTTVAAVGLVPTVWAHGNEADTGMGAGDGMPMMAPDKKPDEADYPPTYFSHTEHSGLIYAHIAMMVLGWVFTLPVAVMLSLARSRYTLAAQFAFLGVNAVGVLLSTIYNASTPDLYPNNAHHKVGWIATWVVCAQVLVGLLGRIVGAFKENEGENMHVCERQSFIPVSREDIDEHQRLYRLSNDSGQGTERNTESLRSSSVSTDSMEQTARLHGHDKEYQDEDEDLEAHSPRNARHRRAYKIASKIGGLMSSRAWRFLVFGYKFVDRTILILGFITLCLGIIAFGRFFEGHSVFSGLAHWIKGGIFFWLGIFTLGRWAGCFGDLGWAWNVKPKSAGQAWRPSAEFVESALIFTYGSTNIFLEHLGNWGKEYSAQDLEHISITVLFIGGGLCGMLVESTWIRDLLNTTVTEAAHAHAHHDYQVEERDALEPPRTYKFSINPIPALVILLLGIMMSSHTQQTMISSMVHKQWGNLLTGASFARGFTYILLYLKPPKSVYPTRPPTELLAAFGMISGGIIFMASSGDTIDGMIHYDLDAMFMYTVTMGLVGLLMAWVIMCVALKGWAVRRERGTIQGPPRT